MSIELMKRTIVETCRENLCLTLIFLQNKDLNQSVHQDQLSCNFSSVKDLFSARGRYLNIYLSIVSLDEKTVEHSLFYAFKDIYNSRCSSCPCSPLTRYLLFPSNVHQHGP